MALSAVSTTTAAATTAVSTETATRATFDLRTSFVYIQVPASQTAAIQSGNGFFALGVVRHLNKSKTAGLARSPVTNQGDLVHGAMRFKKCPQLLFGCTKVQVSYVNVFDKRPFRPNYLNSFTEMRTFFCSKFVGNAGASTVTTYKDRLYQYEFNFLE